MVVLEGNNMLGGNPNQYLQPDYFSPLPTTLDAKKSPLALLAQTCSQIGADSPTTKSLLPSMSGGDPSKRKSSTSSETSSLKSNDGSDKESSRPPSGQKNGKCSPSFKPYDSSTPRPREVGEKRRRHSSCSSQDKSQASMLNGEHGSKSVTPNKTNGSSNGNLTTSPSPAKMSRLSSPSNGSSSSATSNSNNGSSKSHYCDRVNTPKEKSSSGERSGSSKNKSSSEESSKSNNDRGASPIIRSGMEVLHGKDYAGTSKAAASALSGLSALTGYPAGFDPTNPAFRSPFLGAPGHFLGYPPSTGSPYIGYSRVKNPSGTESIVPVCKDPYCTGCPYSANGAASTPGASPFLPPGLSPFIPTSGASGPSSGSFCPAGCVQCDHQKFPISGLSWPPMGPPPGLSSAALAAAASLYPSSLLSQHAAAQLAQQHAQLGQSPSSTTTSSVGSPSNQSKIICNWIVGDSYCGKRFPTSEELLQHLRTHTNLNSTGPSSNNPSSISVSTNSTTSPGNHSNSSSEAAMAAAVAAAQHPQASSLASLSNPSSLYSSAALLNSSMAAAAAALHRNYPTPPLSPLSAARYNPYAAAAAAAAAAKGSMPSFVPPVPPSSLSSYYPSPYSLYGQRFGPPVHP